MFITAGSVAYVPCHHHMTIGLPHVLMRYIHRREMNVIRRIEGGVQYTFGDHLIEEGKEFLIPPKKKPAQ